MVGDVINLDLISLNAYLHDSSKSNFAFFSTTLYNGLEIFEKSLMIAIFNCCGWQESFYDSNLCLVNF